MVTRRVIQTCKTVKGTHYETNIECPNDSAQLLSFSIEHWHKDHVEYTTITAHWVIKNWAD